MVLFKFVHALNRARLFEGGFYLKVGRHRKVDINTEEHLIPNSELRTRNSHAFKYRMPRVCKEVFKFSFSPRSITEWNTPSADLVNCKSSSLSLLLHDYDVKLGKLPS